MVGRRKSQVSRGNGIDFSCTFIPPFPARLIADSSGSPSAESGRGRAETVRALNREKPPYAGTARSRAAARTHVELSQAVSLSASVMLLVTTT